MNEETRRQRQIMIGLSGLRRKLFRNNVGMAVYKNENGDTRTVKYGLCVGSSDTIGWETITITKEMVGKEVAVFLAIETKVKEKDKGKPAQRNFINAVISAGGIAGIARTVDEARDLISRCLNRLTSNENKNKRRR